MIIYKSAMRVQKNCYFERMKTPIECVGSFEALYFRVAFWGT